MYRFLTLFSLLIATTANADPSTTSFESAFHNGIAMDVIVAATERQQTANEERQYWVVMPNRASALVEILVHRVVFEGSDGSAPTVDCVVANCFDIAYDASRVSSSETLFVASNRKILELQLQTKVEGDYVDLPVLTGLNIECDNERGKRVVSAYFGNTPIRRGQHRTYIAYASLPETTQSPFAARCLLGKSG
jgi:hypothetical protein